MPIKIWQSPTGLLVKIQQSQTCIPLNTEIADKPTIKHAAVQARPDREGVTIKIQQSVSQSVSQYSSKDTTVPAWPASKEVALNIQQSQTGLPV